MNLYFVLEVGRTGTPNYPKQHRRQRRNLNNVASCATLQAMQSKQYRRQSRDLSNIAGNAAIQAASQFKQIAGNDLATLLTKQRTSDKPQNTL
jgi:hypothetical protein